MERGLIPAATELPSEVKLDLSVRGLLDAYAELRDALETGATTKIARALPAAQAIPIERLMKAVAAARLPATVDEISLRVAHLIEVTKHLDKVGPEFGETLVEDLVIERPSQIALVTAMRRLRTTCKFLPSIAEVIETVRAVEADYRSATYRLENLQERIIEASAALKGA